MVVLQGRVVLGAESHHCTACPLRTLTSFLLECPGASLVPEHGRNRRGNASRSTARVYQLVTSSADHSSCVGRVIPDTGMIDALSPPRHADRSLPLEGSGPA